MGVKTVETVAIIGGGPAGYVAAITASRHSKKVILIEEKKLGGTCLNEGCMPTKSLLESAEMFEKVKHANTFGIELPQDEVAIDWSKVQNYKTGVVKRLVQGIDYLMKKNKIQVVEGKATFITEYLVHVQQGDQQEVIEANQFIIAAGSEPVSLPSTAFDGTWIIHSGHAITLREIPATLVIVGGGVIGCEFASIYSRMGTKVTMVEMANQLLPGEDPDIAGILQKQLEKDGVTVYTSTSLKKLNPQSQQVIFESSKGIQEQYADYVLVAIGRKPRVEGLGLDQIGVSYSSKGIIVNDSMQTNLSHIYACGDIIGGIQLAHVAFHEGTIAALHACGKQEKVNYQAVPRCIYSFPEIASVGMTEKQAKEKVGDIRIGEFSFTANGKALILNERIGKVKVIVEPQYNEILGISIIGPHATELIGQAVIMLHTELTTDVIEHMMFAHPTVSEVIHEAMLSAIDCPLHS